MEFIFYIIILLITGLAVGFASGLLGVGGGFIMVPVQFWLLCSLGVDPTIAIRVAFGTSLAVIIPTAISGTIVHQRKSVVLLKPAMFLGVTGFIGAFLGGFVATHTPGDILKFAFGLMILVAALRMLMEKNTQIKKEPIDSALYYVLWGLVVGIVSGVFGVGGGVIMVPLMVIVMNFDIHKAIGTSMAVMIFTSIGGMLSYMVHGLNIVGLPQYSIGYINILQMAVLGFTSIPMAQVGATTLHKLPAREIKCIFIILMVFIALRMMGIFKWLHLPL